MTHLKRLVTSKTWPIQRKETAYTTRPSPGPHKASGSLPLNVVMRDLLKVTASTKETKKVLNSGEILIDHRVRKDHHFPVGIMDILSMPGLKKDYVVAYDLRGRLTFHEMSPKDSAVKLCKIVNKTILKGKKVQLNLYDGRNVNVDPDTYKVGDSVYISLKDMKVAKHLKFEKGALVYLIGGRHVGRYGEIIEIKHFKGIEEDRIVIKSGDENIETLKSYAFVTDKVLEK